MPVNSIYKPISEGEFRIVHLLPGEFSDDLRCILETRSSEIKIHYEALSYEWGDKSITKPIRIANLYSSSPPTLAPYSSTGRLKKAFRTAEQYDIPLQIVTNLVATVLFWLFLSDKSAVFIDPPSWLSWFMSRCVFIALLSLALGAGVQILIFRAFKVVAEVVSTKAWLLMYNSRTSNCDLERHRQSLIFETLQVTTNLELALRYLRLERGPRTLWIDALCINQENEKEKEKQICRMDLVYANASPVVVWLGGYHCTGEAEVCQESASRQGDGGDCVHSREIQAAFDFIWTESSWRVLLPWHHGRREERRFLKSRSGLCEIARRGWWNRLWVIQEIALATGQVQIQCGHKTCDFDDFQDAHKLFLATHPKDEELHEYFRPVERILNTIKEFRYSFFHGTPFSFTKMLGQGTHRLLYRNDAAEFHEQLFAARLHRILLRTAGQFRCHEDRDRLYAVLGITGGSRRGKSAIANLLEVISQYDTIKWIAILMRPWIGASASPPLKFAAFLYYTVYSLWVAYYDSRAKHWTIDRPQFVVAGYKEVFDTITGGIEGRQSRVRFFTGLARYIAEETNSLAFLDVATCGDDEDKGMPSWVPNWGREVHSLAYDFATRVKKGQALDVFRFADGGKTLVLLGQFRGAVYTTMPLASLGFRASPAILCIYSQGQDERQSKLNAEIGLVTAGNAAKGDSLVFVPGCFHLLMLRRQTQTTATSIHWKLVGLMTPIAEMGKLGRLRDEWAQCFKETYTIV